jgi:hypothetical protein
VHQNPLRLDVAPSFLAAPVAATPSQAHLIGAVAAAAEITATAAVAVASRSILSPPRGNRI